MKHGSLFSGLGGFDLAASWLGWENVFQVEIDPFCNKILSKHFPDTKRFNDIKQFDGTQFRGQIDVLSGGFPCQPFSQAGKRKGNDDERALFPEMLRVIREIKPRFVVAENVLGIISMAHDEIYSSLESEGYEVGTFVIPALAVGAPHYRRRVWFVAHSLRDECQESNKSDPAALVTKQAKARSRLRPDGPLHMWDQPPPPCCQFCRVPDGLLSELHSDLLTDRIKRIKALGNSIVPQIAYLLFRGLEWS